MKKTKKTKTKLSSIMDNSSMGFTFNTECGNSQIPIQRETFIQLTKLMEKHPLFQSWGTDRWLLDCKGSSISYEFKKSGKNYFLNVTGNPTKLLSGSNDIPILIKDKHYSDNAVLNTMMYANRVMFAMLQYIDGFDFKWPQWEYKKLEGGEINISRLQLAWYSGDLEDERDAVLRYLRTCYGGLDATQNRVVSVAANLGLQVKLHQNHCGNLTIEKAAGNNRSFSLTFYAKDEEPSYAGNKDRLKTLIRFDCTFLSYFLERNGIKTIAQFERVFPQKCDEYGGYDIGFVRWMSDQVYEALNLDYILSTNASSYEERLSKLEALSLDTKKKNESRLAHWWIQYGEVIDQQVCKSIEVDWKNIQRYRSSIQESTGININFNRWAHESLLLNRIVSTMDPEERFSFITTMKDSNMLPKLSELRERDQDNSERLKNIIARETQNTTTLRIRKLKPRVISSFEDFWFYKQVGPK